MRGNQQSNLALNVAQTINYPLRSTVRFSRIVNPPWGNNRVHAWPGTRLSQQPSEIYIYISTIDPSFGVIWRFPEKGVPLNSPFIDGFSIINIYKPSILGYPHDYGSLHINYVSLFLYQLSHSKLQKPAFPQPQRSTFADDLASNVVAVVRICKVTSMAGEGVAVVVMVNRFH